MTGGCGSLIKLGSLGAREVFRRRYSCMMRPSRLPPTGSASLRRWRIFGWCLACGRMVQVPFSCLISMTNGLASVNSFGLGPTLGAINVGLVGLAILVAFFAFVAFVAFIVYLPFLGFGRHERDIPWLCF